MDSPSRKRASRVAEGHRPAAPEWTEAPRRSPLRRSAARGRIRSSDSSQGQGIGAYPVGLDVKSDVEPRAIAAPAPQKARRRVSLAHVHGNAGWISVGAHVGARASRKLAATNASHSFLSGPWMTRDRRPSIPRRERPISIEDQERIRHPLHLSDESIRLR